jgi:heme exporter protein D
MDLGPHAAFIWMAYGATTLVVTALIARAILDERKQKRILVKLDEQGIRRRSTRAPSDRMPG